MGVGLGLWPFFELVTAFNLMLGLLLIEYMGSVVFILHFYTLRADFGAGVAVYGRN